MELRIITAKVILIIIYHQKGGNKKLYQNIQYSNTV